MPPAIRQLFAVILLLTSATVRFALAASNPGCRPVSLEAFAAAQGADGPAPFPIPHGLAVWTDSDRHACVALDVLYAGFEERRHRYFDMFMATLQDMADKGETGLEAYFGEGVDAATAWAVLGGELSWAEAEARIASRQGYQRAENGVMGDLKR